MSEGLIRFLIGGLLVSAFATVGSLFRPPSFAGLFSAAPSVALATLTLAITKNGKMYAGTESRSMIAGAAAVFVYSILVSHILVRVKISALKATLCAMPAWFLTAFGLWFILLR